MTKSLAAWLVLLSLVCAPILLGMLTGGSGGLAYVVSESMEPTLFIGDGFIMVPAGEVQVGDVITFYPITLDADQVTHRITGVAADGFITRGDNNAASDQAVGEPPVVRSRMIGKAVAWDGAIIRIPHLGRFSQFIRDLLGKHVAITAVALLGFGLIMVFIELARPSRHRRSRMRWRVGHLYGLISTGALAVLMATMMLGSRVHSVAYLASVNPGSAPNHVRAGEPGTVRLSVSNMGLVPVLHFSKGVGGATVVSAPDGIGPRDKGVVELRTPTRATPGWYREYIRVYHYPPLLPRPVVAWLFRISPYLAMAGLVTALGAVLAIIAQFINTWTPLTGPGTSLLTIIFRRLARTPSARRRRL